MNSQFLSDNGTTNQHNNKNKDEDKDVSWTNDLDFDDSESNLDSNNPCKTSPTDDFPSFTTTYTSGSFIVSKKNILSIPFSFYQNLYHKLYVGPQYVDTTCGALEYLWTTLWGGKPFNIQPDLDSWCGPLYFADIASNYGFLFYKSDDGSVEAGYLPDRYHGYIYNQNTHEIKPGIHKYEDELE